MYFNLPLATAVCCSNMLSPGLNSVHLMQKVITYHWPHRRNSQHFCATWREYRILYAFSVEIYTGNNLLHYCMRLQHTTTVAIVRIRLACFCSIYTALSSFLPRSIWNCRLHFWLAYSDQWLQMLENSSSTNQKEDSMCYVINGI